MRDQIHGWVSVHGRRYVACKSYRGQERFDCVRLVHALTATDGGKFSLARLMWIVVGLSDGPLCVAVPLFKNHSFKTEPFGSAAIASFEAVERKSGVLVAFCAKLISQLEQVQFIPKYSQQLGLVNKFYHSNIMDSTFSQQASVEVREEQSDLSSYHSSSE